MDTFIQPKITGYRQLTPEEASLMNEGKALAEQCGAYIEKLRAYVPAGDEPSDHKPGDEPSDHKPAAAPDLLAALRAMLALVRRNAPELSGKILGDADAAIAKATGAGAP